jgi:hypothetical protein
MALFRVRPTEADIEIANAVAEQTSPETEGLEGYGCAIERSLASAMQIQAKNGRCGSPKSCSTALASSRY